MKVLIIEDDNTVRKIIKESLKGNNFDIFDTSNPVEGLKILKDEKIEFIILDIILPDIDGFGVCKIIRQYPKKYGNPFILMLTTKKEENDVLKGLEYGADDYMKKPFSYKELIARINAIRRRNERTVDIILKYAEIIIDTEKEIVYNSKDNLPIELFRKEYDLLLYMVKNQGIVLTRENIFQNAWDEIYYEGNRAIDNYIWKLKLKVPEIAEKIQTIRGMGYKLEKI